LPLLEQPCGSSTARSGKKEGAAVIAEEVVTGKKSNNQPATPTHGKPE